ncbi:MAG: ATP-binding protein [Clostridiales bacterium]|nr:ATP-binding protein [Clostridiales bacterium]
MGKYLNPGNRGFRAIRNGTYVDKTGLIAFVNSTINISPDRLTCFSRPRRFGKSYAAKTLCAYYDKTCDSGDLFEGLAIAEEDSFETYLNQFDVIYLDITRFISTTSDIKKVVREIQKKVIEELHLAYSGYVKVGETVLADALFSVSHVTGNQFIIIIDEWDALFREAKSDDLLQKEYVQLLRGLFKGGTATDETIAAAYMTGILPIKKYGTESALTDFQEYTMVSPDMLSSYVGFTESEVRSLCEQTGMDFEEMKCWYDGYAFLNLPSVYNPDSVMSAVRRKNCRSYWTSSETYESLKNYITRNFDGLKDTVVQMLGGRHINVDISTFQNDMTSFENRDDVLTLLIHLGYLSYDEKEREIFIPNLEVADAFRAAVKGTDWNEVNLSLSQSDNLLKATIRCDSEMVAEALEMAHETCSSSLAYNDENSLSCAILLAYYTAQNDYEMIREFPSGKGFADYAFVPRSNSNKQAMIIELKYNKSADTAIRQIRENRYSGRLSAFSGEILLVGINYDKKAKGENRKKHTCIIEKVVHN